MSITRTALERNRVTALTLFVLFLSGIGAYRSLPRDEDPGFVIRTAAVTTVFPGASPERVELLVTDKLEKVIQEMPELDVVRSESRVGLSLVYVDIEQKYEDMRPICDDLRRKVEAARSELPEGVIGPSVDDEFGEVFGTILTITGDGFDYRQIKVVADEVRDELLRIDDVAKVELFGAQDERVFVEYDNARLAELGLSPYQFQQILESRNIIISGGSVRVTSEDSDERMVLEPSGNFESVEDIRRTVVSLPGRSDVVHLEDLARVERGYVDPPETRARSSGTQAIALSISMQADGNIVDLGEKVSALKRELEARYPHGIEFDVVAFQPARVEKKIREFVGNLLQAVGIVFLVMLIFLGPRTGVVVATLVPGAILASFLFFAPCGVGLNQISLAALIIALGMLVDNAIVMSESIMVQIAEGKPPVQAAVDSAGELRFPLLTSTLTTSAAFLPIYLAESDAGEYTGPIFVVVTITLLCSWVLALTMIPLLCVRFVRVRRREGSAKFDSPFYRLYRRILVAALRHRLASLVLAAGVFLLGMLGFRLVPVLFFPPSDRTIITAELRLPPGTPIERTEAVVADIERFVLDELMHDPESGRDGVTSFSSYIGQGAPRFILTYSPGGREPEYAMLLFNTKSAEAIGELIARLQAYCAESHPDLEAALARLDYGPPVKWKVEVRLSGRDSDRTFAHADEVKAWLRALPGVTLVRDDWGARTKKLLVQVDQERAYRAGVSNLDVAISLQTMLSGLETTQYREGDKVIPVIMRSPAAWRDQVDKLESINVYSQVTGSSVPLSSVADIEVGWQPSKILRRDRLRTVTVQAQLAPGVTATEITDELVPWLEEHSAGWDPGYYWELGGEHETSGEANRSIVAKLPIAGFVILMLLVGQFNSIRRTAIVLLTIPLGLVGVVIGLLVTGSYFGFMTLLGIVSLSGIVINNAIVLIDRIRIEIDENGLDPPRAVVESAQRRLRPILLTTCTTIGGLLPLWFGGGLMFEPMAIGIVFGLAFATLLTLGFVPVLYSLLFAVSFERFRY